MGIAWGSLFIVCVISLAVGVAIVALVAFALVGLSARAHVPAGGPDDGAPTISPGAGTAIAFDSATPGEVFDFLDKELGSL